MAERIVINTGPLVALARADALELIGTLPFEFVCPEAVRTELDLGAAAGHIAVHPPWLSVMALANPLHPVAAAVLDAGEAAVIQLALDERIAWVCIDERAGRRIAVAVGLRVVGTLGLLLHAKRLGKVEAVRPLIERLNAAGSWYDEAVIRRVLESAGE